MRRWLPLLPLLTLLAACEPSALATDPGETTSTPQGPGIVVRTRPGRFLCGLPPDEGGRTCLFIPEEGAAR